MRQNGGSTVRPVIPHHATDRALTNGSDPSCDSSLCRLTLSSNPRRAHARRTVSLSRLASHGFARNWCAGPTEASMVSAEDCPDRISTPARSAWR